MKKAILTLLALALAAPVFAQQAIVEKIRREYPVPLGELHGKFLVEVACVTGKGLLKKDWGTFVRVADGTGVAQDIVMDKDGTHYDILGDGENLAIPSWSLVTDPPKVDPARYYAPVCNNTPPAPVPDPVPGVVDVLQALIATMAEVEAHFNARLDALANTIENHTQEIKARPFPEYEVVVFGQRVTVRPKQ